MSSQRLARNPSAVLFLLLLCSPLASADIPEPPMLVYGSLENGAGIEVTAGELRFDFAPAAGGTTVRVNALVGALAPGIHFVAEVPLESNGVSDPAAYLAHGSNYTPRVYYAAVQLPDPQLPAPLAAERGRLIGPLAYVVSPVGALASVSADVDFGIVRVGDSLDRSFLISNPGTVALAGSCSLLSALDFTLIDGGAPVGEIPVALDPGATMRAAVRFAPAAPAAALVDTFRLTTNAGVAERTVAGTASLFAAEDLNQDGIINQIDLWTLAGFWFLPRVDLPYGREAADLDASGKVDHGDLMRLIRKRREEASPP